MIFCRKRWFQPQSSTGSTADWWTLWTVSRPTWTFHSRVILSCAFCLEPITELCNTCVCLTTMKRSLFLSYDYCSHVLLRICGTLPHPPAHVTAAFLWCGSTVPCNRESVGWEVEFFLLPSWLMCLIKNPMAGGFLCWNRQSKRTFPPVLCYIFVCVCVDGTWLQCPAAWEHEHDMSLPYFEWHGCCENYLWLCKNNVLFY